MAEQRAAGQFPRPSVLLVIALFIALLVVLVFYGISSGVDLSGLVDPPALNVGGDDQSEVLPPVQEPTSTPQPTNTPTQTQMPSTTPTPTQTPTSTPTPRPTPVLEWTEDDADFFNENWLWQVMQSERFKLDLGCSITDPEVPQGHDDPLVEKYFHNYQYCPCPDEDLEGKMCVLLPLRVSNIDPSRRYWDQYTHTLEKFSAWDRCLIFGRLYLEYGWEYYSEEERLEILPPHLIERLGDPNDYWVTYCPNFDPNSEWCSQEATGGRCNTQQQESE